MNRVTGRVVVRESGEGVPRLEATLYDASSAAEPRDHSTDPRVDGAEQPRWNRLASVITDNQGTFNINYNIENDVPKSRRRFDLLLTISSPEDSCITEEQEKRNIATCIRRNAAAVESFLITVEEKKLEAFGIHMPDSRERADAMIKRHRAAADYNAQLEAESKRLVAERLKKRREHELKAESKFSKFLSAISAVSMDRHNLDGPTRHVPTGTSVRTANREVIRHNIQTRINEATATSSVVLTDSQAEAFKDSNGSFMAEIAASLRSSLIIDRSRIQGGPGSFRKDHVKLSAVCSLEIHALRFLTMVSQEEAMVMMIRVKQAKLSLISRQELMMHLQLKLLNHPYLWL